MFKYLFGMIRQHDDKDDNRKRGNALVITRRSDAYQHREMARDVGMIPFNGGFCGSALNFDDTYLPGSFNGESISCRVKTDNHGKDIETFLKETDIYICYFGKFKNLVAAFIPTGNKVADPINKEIPPDDWKKVTPEEFCSIFIKEFDS